MYAGSDAQAHRELGPGATRGGGNSEPGGPERRRRPDPEDEVERRRLGTLLVVERAADRAPHRRRRPDADTDPHAWPRGHQESDQETVLGSPNGDVGSDAHEPERRRRLHGRGRSGLRQGGAAGVGGGDLAGDG